jgi:hypothetical protein
VECLLWREFALEKEQNPPMDEHQIGRITAQLLQMGEELKFGKLKAI